MKDNSDILNCKYCNAKFEDKATLHFHEGLHELFSSNSAMEFMTNG